MSAGGSIMPVSFLWVSVNTVLCAFSVAVDFIALYIRVFGFCNPARIFLWTSWMWSLVRWAYGSVNHRLWYNRALWKGLLLLICLACFVFDSILSQVAGNNPNIVFDHALNSSYSKDVGALMDNFPRQINYNEIHWGSFFILWIHLCLWEWVESHNRAKRFLDLYAILLGAMALYVSRVAWAVVPFMLLLVKIITDEVRCAAMIVMLMSLTTVRSEIFWIVKFTMILPYFFQFITTHAKRRMHAEIKIFKHLGDLVLFLFLIN